MVILNISPLDNYAITCCDNYRGGYCVKVIVSRVGYSTLARTSRDHERSYSI